MKLKILVFLLCYKVLCVFIPISQQALRLVWNGTHILTMLADQIGIWCHTNCLTHLNCFKFRNLRSGAFSMFHNMLFKHSSLMTDSILSFLDPNVNSSWFILLWKCGRELHFKENNVLFMEGNSVGKTEAILCKDISHGNFCVCVVTSRIFLKYLFFF